MRRSGSWGLVTHTHLYIQEGYNFFFLLHRFVFFQKATIREECPVAENIFKSMFSPDSQFPRPAASFSGLLSSEQLILQGISDMNAKEEESRKENHNFDFDQEIEDSGNKRVSFRI